MTLHLLDMVNKRPHSSHQRHTFWVSYSTSINVSAEIMCSIFIIFIFKQQHLSYQSHILTFFGLLFDLRDHQHCKCFCLHVRLGNVCVLVHMSLHCVGSWEGSRWPQMLLLPRGLYLPLSLFFSLLNRQPHSSTIRDSILPYDTCIQHTQRHTC